MSSARREIRFLTRSGCSLCDVAFARLRLPARLLRVDVVAVDIDEVETLVAEFGGRVPVLLSRQGEVLAEGRVSGFATWRAAWRSRRA